MQPRKEKFINYFNIILDFEISHKPGLFRNSTYIGVLTVFSYLSFSLAMSKNLSTGHRNHISSPKYPLFSSLSALFFSVPKSSTQVSHTPSPSSQRLFCQTQI
jgi:hypothetical protein